MKLCDVLAGDLFSLHFQIFFPDIFHTFTHETGAFIMTRCWALSHAYADADCIIHI